MKKAILQNPWFSGLIGILILSISYAAVGRLALMLAIPPGYATAIFPPAGIAVAALLIWGNRLWPGVFLGSVLLNIWVNIAKEPLAVSGIEVAVSTAIGSSLQALLGAWLVNRFIGFPTTLSKEKDIIWFMLLAGPIACIIAACFGVTGLYVTGTITGAEYAYSWFTWWIGDTIGILITVPLVFIVFASPRELWWRRRKAVGVPLLLMLTGVIVLFVWVSKLELERTQFQFKEISNHTHDKLSASFSGYIDAAASIERFFSSSKNVSRKQFRSFVEYTLENKPGIKGLSWNPMILKEQRNRFEKSIQREGLINFRIKERNKQGQLIRAADRAQFIVVKYIEPMKQNRKALGFDVASNQERRKALFQARDSGQAIATAPIRLVQENTKVDGFLLFQPVYKGPHKTKAERRKNLKGFAVGVFHVGGIVDSVLSEQYQNKINVDIYDRNSKGYKQLYGSPVTKKSSRSLFKLTKSLEIGRRIWTVNYRPSSEYIAAHRGWQAWVVLSAGLLFSSILGVFMLTITGRSYHIEELVALRTAELSGILSTAIEAIITLDQDGDIESINPAGESLFGYTSAELFSRPIHTLIPGFFKNSPIDVSEKQSSRLKSNRHDSYGIRKDKTSVPIELAISTVNVSNRTFYTAIIHDLTERRKVDRMKEEFISTVSHELRTPLTSIKGSLGLLNHGALGVLSEKMKRMLEIAYQNSERLERLINDLLDISKAESTEPQFRMEPICVKTLINNAILSNQGYADNYGVSFQWETSEADDAFVKGDEHKLIQALTNLFSNAVKYSPKGAQVVISAERRNKRVRISVTDSGPGIPLEFRGRIFDRFTQADSSNTRRIGGTGLGLAITRLIIENHGGNIGFTSTPGHGSTFYFELPAIVFSTLIQKHN